MNRVSYGLFLGDLSVYCTKSDLERLLAPFGPITDIRIKQDFSTGKKLSYGFVEFVHMDSAMAVMNTLNGLCIVWKTTEVKINN